MWGVLLISRLFPVNPLDPDKGLTGHPLGTSHHTLTAPNDLWLHRETSPMVPSALTLSSKNPTACNLWAVSPFLCLPPTSIAGVPNVFINPNSQQG